MLQYHHQKQMTSLHTLIVCSSERNCFQISKQKGADETLREGQHIDDEGELSIVRKPIIAILYLKGYIFSFTLSSKPNHVRGSQ